MPKTHLNLFVILSLVCGAAISRAGNSILKELPTNPTLDVSTVPANGDVNPYGVAFVPEWFPTGGTVNPGDILVSNFNASSNIQGTGTTIMDVTQTGSPKLYFQGQQGLGLTTALGALSGGYVLVGNVPTTD